MTIFGDLCYAEMGLAVEVSQDIFKIFDKAFNLTGGGYKISDAQCLASTAPFIHLEFSKLQYALIFVEPRRECT